MTIGSQITRAFTSWRDDRVRETDRFLDRLADETTREMKDTAPWQDRTRDARNAVRMKADPVRGGHGYFTIILHLGYDDMPNDLRGGHGFWLEHTKHGASTGETPRQRRGRGRRMVALRAGSSEWGDYAIVYPTAAGLAPKIADELRTIWRNDFGYRPRVRVLAQIGYNGVAAPPSPATNIPGASGAPPRPRSLR